MMMTTTKKKNIQEAEEEQKPNPGGGGGGGGGGEGSTSSTTDPYSPPPDRISELPVEILHRILGFLEMDEFLIRTSLISTKWRNLWKSVSVLKFSRCHCFCFDDDSGCTLKYQNFVDHVLHLRDSEASKIEIFRYYCLDSFRRREFNYDLLERLHNFIVNAAVNQDAQEIIINCQLLCDQRGDMIIHLNPSIFNSNSRRPLRKFTFNIRTDTPTDFIIQFPRSMCCATQLTYLSLYRIRLPEGDDDAQLHLVCPLLETLDMTYCYTKHLKVLHISAPKLNILSIDNFAMRSGHSYDGLGGCRIEIHTPNLTKFVFRGDVYVDCFMENLPRVASAYLDFRVLETGMAEKITSFAIKLLKGLTNAQSLTLKGFQVFSQDTFKCLLTPFTSLTTLELSSSCKISSIHGAVHFLSSCSNSIKKFVWEVDSTVKMGGDEHLMLPQCRLSHLKHVCIEMLRGHENEIEFVKFLLKSSVVLEDLIIKTAKNSPKQTIEENLKQIIEEEPSFRSIKLCVLQGKF